MVGLGLQRGKETFKNNGWRHKREGGGRGEVGVRAPNVGPAGSSRGEEPGSPAPPPPDSENRHPVPLPPPT